MIGYQYFLLLFVGELIWQPQSGDARHKVKHQQPQESASHYSCGDVSSHIVNFPGLKTLMILVGKVRQFSFLIIRELNMLNIVNARLAGLQMLCSSTLVFSMLLASGAAMADRPEWAGSRNGYDLQYQKHRDKRGESYREGNDRHENRYEGRRESDRYEGRRGGVVIQIGGYFDDRRRSEIHEYYHERERSGRCPPGLAKKHNGCVPPGHDRRWSRGEYLPRDVIYHPVEPEILIRLGTPPAGHRFVRVAADILLIALGTGLVVDAIDDLGQ